MKFFHEAAAAAPRNLREAIQGDYELLMQLLLSRPNLRAINRGREKTRSVPIMHSKTPVHPAS